MCVLACALKILFHSKIFSSNKRVMSTIHRCKDETKRDERSKTKRTKIIINVNDLITAILEEPGLWILPE